MRENNSEINIYLIRHGEAGKSWDEDPDPGLSEKGIKQSEQIVTYLSEELKDKSYDVISSPLLRAKQTAIPLQKVLNFEISINDSFAEIPSPGIKLSERKSWLQNIFDSKIIDLESPQVEWREKIMKSLIDLNQNTLIFSHFMVINCVAGWINQQEKVVNFYPDNCSITKIQKKEGELELIKLGEELNTIVQ